MMSITLGSLALPTMPVLLLLSVVLASWIAGRLDGPERRASSLLFNAAVAGLLVARVAHVLLNAEAYSAQPLAVLDVRDGGFHRGFGLLGALIGLVGQAAWLSRTRVATEPSPIRRKALVAGALAGLSVWVGGSVAVNLMTQHDVPDLAFVDMATGRPVALRDVAARGPLVLNLWASWCGPCQREMPDFAAAQAAHPGVTFVFVNQGESPAIIQRFVDHVLTPQGLAIHNVLLDNVSQLGPALGSRGLPTTVFYNAQGERVDAHMGPLNSAALKAKVAAIQ